MSWIDRILRKDRHHASDAATLAKLEGGGTILRRQTVPLVDGVETASALDFGVGARVADTFVVKRLLGAGGMGVVYLAHHERWSLDVVLKVPNDMILADPANRHRITTESARAAWLSHPALVRRQAIRSDPQPAATAIYGDATQQGMGHRHHLHSDVAGVALAPPQSSRRRESRALRSGSQAGPTGSPLNPGNSMGATTKAENEQLIT